MCVHDSTFVKSAQRAGEARTTTETGGVSSGQAERLYNPSAESHVEYHVVVSVFIRS